MKGSKDEGTPGFLRFRGCRDVGISRLWDLGVSGFSVWDEYEGTFGFCSLWFS